MLLDSAQLLYNSSTYFSKRCNSMAIPEATSKTKGFKKQKHRQGIGHTRSRVKRFVSFTGFSLQMGRFVGSIKGAIFRPRPSIHTFSKSTSSSGFLRNPRQPQQPTSKSESGSTKPDMGWTVPSRINRPKFDDYGRRGFDRSPWKTNRDWGGPRSGRERGGRGGVRETKAHLRFSSAVALGFVRSSLLSVRLVTGPPIGDRKRRRNDAWPTTSGTTVGMTRYDWSTKPESEHGFSGSRKMEPDLTGSNNLSYQKIRSIIINKLGV